MLPDIFYDPTQRNVRSSRLVSARFISLVRPSIEEEQKKLIKFFMNVLCSVAVPCACHLGLPGCIGNSEADEFLQRLP